MLIYGTTLFIVAYYFIFLLYFYKLFPSNKKRAITGTVIAVVGILTIYIFIKSEIGRMFSYLFLIGVMTLGLKLATSMKLYQAIHGAIYSVMGLYGIRSSLIGIFALIRTDDQTNLLLDNSVYYILTIISVPLALFFQYLIGRYLLPPARIKNLLNSKKHSTLVIVYEFIASANLLIINKGRMISVNAQWYLEIALGAAVLALGMLIFSMVHSAEVLELTEYKGSSEHWKQQHKRQVEHYQAHEKYIDLIRRFRHDFSHIIDKSIPLLQNSENEKVLTLLSQMQNTMVDIEKNRKQYTNHVIQDSLLQDLEKTCIQNQISITIKACAPLKTGISLLNVMRIFTNITHNAVEACLKLPEHKRFIAVVGANQDGWTYLQVSNSFDGVINKKNGVFLSSKADQGDHGLGLITVEEIVKSHGGFVVYNIDEKQKVFLIRIHFPEQKAE